MEKKRFLLGTLIMVLALGMTVIGCDDGDNGGNKTPPYVPSELTPLTGTVTVSSNITLESQKEKMTLTADTSDFNASSLHYQWQRDGVNISGASSKTYVVVEADYGKTLKVNVTASAYSGEQSGQITVPSPTIMNISVKYDSTTSSNASRRKGVIFETESGRTLGYTSGTLGTTAQTVTISSWQENNPSWKVTKFKIKFDNGLLSYPFKKTGTTDELFDLVNGSKTYILTFTTTGSTDHDFFAVEE